MEAADVLEAVLVTNHKAFQTLKVNLHLANCDILRWFFSLFLKLAAESAGGRAVQSCWPTMITLMNLLIFSSGKWTLFFVNLHFAALAFTGILTSLNFPGASSVCPPKIYLSICRREYNLRFNIIICHLPSNSVTLFFCLFFLGTTVGIQGPLKQQPYDHTCNNTETWTESCLHSECGACY